jgi:uncharacterized membrane protein
MGRAPLREILPVQRLDYEDLRESAEGFRAEPAVRNHPILIGLNSD